MKTLIANLRTQVTSVIGILIGLVGVISQPGIANLIPGKYSGMIATAGVILAALGRSLTAPTNAPSGITAQTVATALTVDTPAALNRALARQDLPPVDITSKA